MRGSRRHRRAFALAACVLWLLGVEVLPDLHLAHHHGDHTHAADGAIVAAFDDHDDDGDRDHDHDGDHDDGPDADDDAQPAIDHPPHPNHLAGGLSHHAAALHRPPPPLLAPVQVARTVWRVEAPADALPRSASISRPTSRGPPTA